MTSLSMHHQAHELHINTHLLNLVQCILVIQFGVIIFADSEHFYDINTDMVI